MPDSGGSLNVGAAMVEETHNLKVALYWAAMGIPVFPVQPENKAPYYGFTGWEQRASTDVNQLRLWWLDYPNAAPALSIGRVGLVVLDADRKPGRGDGVVAFLDLCSEIGIDPASVPRFITPSTGQHAYFRQNGVALGNSEGSIRGREINVRGHGGYVVAPYAITSAGQYLPVGGSPGIDAVYEIPAGLVDLLTASKDGRSDRPISLDAELTAREPAFALGALKGWYNELSETTEGGRNNKLNVAAHKMAQMVARGWIDDDTVWQALSAAARNCGLSAAETLQTYRSGVNAGRRNPHPDLETLPPVPGMETLAFPGTSGVSHPDAPSPQLGSAGVEASEAPRLAAGLQRLEIGINVPSFEDKNPDIDDSLYPFAPGRLGQIMEFIHEQSVPPRRQYTIAGGLAFAAQIAGSGWNVAISGRPSGLNLYLSLVGTSGTGKSNPRAGISTLVTATAKLFPGILSFVGPQAISPSGLRDYFSQSSSYLVLFNEWESFVNQMKFGSRNSNAQELAASLLAWFDASGDVENLPMTGHKDPKLRSKKIVGPSFSLLADSTPNVFASFNDHTITSGFAPRHLFFIYEGAGDDASYLGRPIAVPNQDLIQAIAYIAQRASVIQGARNTEDANLRAQYPTGVCTPSAEAWPILLAFEAALRPVRAACDDVSRALLNRTVIQAARVAALCAVFDNPMAPTISAAHMAWACELVRRCTFKLLDRVTSGRFGSGDRTAVVKVREVIRDAFIAGHKPSYRVTRDMIAAHCLPYAYLLMRCSSIEPFKSHPRGATYAIENAVKTLETMGELFTGTADECSQNKFLSGRMGTRGAKFIRVSDPDLRAEKW
jgi:hypothetical protein